MLGEEPGDVVARRLADGDDSESAGHVHLQDNVLIVPHESDRVTRLREARSPPWVSRNNRERPSAELTRKASSRQEVRRLDSARRAPIGHPGDLLRPQGAGAAAPPGC